MRSRFGHLFQKHDDRNWYLRVRLHGKERTFFAGVTEKDARLFQSKMHAEVGQTRTFGAKAKRKTLREWQKDLNDRFDARHAESTARSDKSRLDRIVAKIGDVVLSTLTRGDVEAMLDSFKFDEVATRNRYRSLMSTIMDLAVERGFATSNPVGDNEREAIKDVAFVSAEDRERGIDKAREMRGERFAALVTIAVNTAMREGELGNATWPKASVARSTITVPESKSRRPRDVPLNPPAVAALQWMLDTRGPIPMEGPDYIWPEFAGRRSEQIGKFWREVAAAAKMPWTFHQFGRHGCCSLLAQANVSLPTIAKIAGHSSIVTTMRYASHMPGGAVFEAVNRLVPGKTKEDKA